MYVEHKCLTIVAHSLDDKTGFDVDLRKLSSRTGQMPWKTSHNFTGSTQWGDISAFLNNIQIKELPHQYR